MDKANAAQRPIILSYGGGTQSAALCVLIGQGKLPRPERIVIADTGREATQTWEYLHQIINPYMGSFGLTVEVAPHSLATVDLYASKSGKPLLPMYTKDGKMPGFCSSEWKKAVVRRYLRGLGYGPARPVTMWIGISLDEIGRAKPADVKWIDHEWPLLMPYGLNRTACKRLVIDAGLPEPPKSSCWMCPYRSDKQWKQLKEHYPDDFNQAAALEKEISQRDTEGGLWLTKHRRALADVAFADTEPDLTLFGEVEHCDSGFCWV